MNDKIDVLAATSRFECPCCGDDEATPAFGHRTCTACVAEDVERSLEINEHRAAIAELIEAAAEVRAAHRELPSVDHPAEVRQKGEARIGRAHYALEGALARVGGAK